MANKPIHAIRTVQEYEAALQEIESLMDAGAGTPEGERLEVLSILVEYYEDKHFPIDDPDPIEAIKCRMEEQDMNVTDLGKLIGYKSRASEILNKKRKLNLSMIRVLNKALKIPLSVLVQPY
ncbi:MAG: transcriptional regulator [Bacteroidota bacterium]